MRYINDLPIVNARARTVAHHKLSLEKKLYKAEGRNSAIPQRSTHRECQGKNYRASQAFIENEKTLQKWKAKTMRYNNDLPIVNARARNIAHHKASLKQKQL